MSVALEEMKLKDIGSNLLIMDSSTYPKVCSNVIITKTPRRARYHLIGYHFCIRDGKGEWIEWSRETDVSLKKVMEALFKLK